MGTVPNDSLKNEPENASPAHVVLRPVNPGSTESYVQGEVPRKCASLLEVIQRVDGDAADFHLEVQVCAVRVARVAHRADVLAARHVIAGFHVGCI